MKNTITISIVLTALIALPSLSHAQNVSKPPARASITRTTLGPAGADPRLNQPSQAAEIKNQLKGKYIDMQRSALPAGAINHNWALRCSETDSIKSVIYSEAEEIRVRARQMVGTVLVFPETVSLMASGLGKTITLDAYPNSKSLKAKLWVLGAVKPGVDGNIAFIAATNRERPKIYTLRVQTEGTNTENCPDTVVYINDTVDSGVRGLAAQIHEGMGADGGTPKAGMAVKFDDPGEVQPESSNSDNAELDGTGRQSVDWLEGHNFRPDALDFNWTLGGDDEGRAFAPDIVFSDEKFMYLKWDQKRFSEILLPAVSAVVETDAGRVDSPVIMTVRGSMLVIQSISDLTLEMEGVVVCVRRPESVPTEGS